MRIEPVDSNGGTILRFFDDGLVLGDVASPVIAEFVRGDGLQDVETVVSGYRTVESDGREGLVGDAQVTSDDGTRLRVTDRWLPMPDQTWRLERVACVEAVGDCAGVRLSVAIAPLPEPTTGFNDFRFFAPGAMWDMNDLDEDGTDDYYQTRTLVYRDDRLTARCVMAHRADEGRFVYLAREDRPQFDPKPARECGQVRFIQRTDIGSIGLYPADDEPETLVFTACYPFVERDRTHALDITTQQGWGVFWPAETGEDFGASYLIGFGQAETPQAALWDVWKRRMRDMAPVPVELGASLEEIAALRVDAMLDYYVEDATGDAAGFVTNCHPQDGRQLANVIQYGFTGQNILCAVDILRSPASRHHDPQLRRQALRVIGFYVKDALSNEHGLTHGLYNYDLARYDSWWTGLLLPLAYAAPGDDLEALMGPLYDRLRDVITGLRGREGTYFRCLSEEYETLLTAYTAELSAGDDQTDWLEAATRFGDFLVEAQNDDGSWFRCYSLDGTPVTEPVSWFGLTAYQQKSSTATAVPMLLRLAELTGRADFAECACRAAGYAYDVCVRKLKFNGGIHDSVYCLPQLIDHESIIFAFRAQLEAYRFTGNQLWLDRATEAAWITCSWIWLWDVPLPEESSLARFGFRSTGWTGCNNTAPGFIHSMGLVLVPDLVEIARLTGEPAFIECARLILGGCNETVALSDGDWGYARAGLQEEGLLISWNWADDPLYQDTAFGGRRKGEGNKTCLPWIGAIGAWSVQELLARYGTTDVSRIGMDSTRLDEVGRSRQR